MKLKIFLTVIFFLTFGKIVCAQNISEIPVDLNDKESCKKYVELVCEETVKLLNQEWLPPAPDYTLLKKAVEKISDGENTVILDEVGYPSIMFKISQFDSKEILENVGGVHPMFIVQEKIYPCVYISKYENMVAHNRAYSLPNVDPATMIGMDVARAVCKAKGRGWHVTTNIEYAGISYICHKQNFYPHGNTNADIDENFYPGETGEIAAEKRTSDGKIIVRRMKTGTGPATWAHNGKENGIYDLNGNIWEMADGLRLVNGEIQIIQNNDAVLPECWNNWRALNKNGKLVKQGSKNTWHIDSTLGDDKSNFGRLDVTPFFSLERKIPMYAVKDTNRNFSFVVCEFKDLKAAENLKIPAILQLHAIYPPPLKNLPADRFWVRNYGERRIMRGGMWARSAGMFGSTMAGAWNDISAGMGFRSAYIDLEEK